VLLDRSYELTALCTEVHDAAMAIEVHVRTCRRCHLRLDCPDLRYYQARAARLASAYRVRKQGEEIEE
jgi:hypothetical protein